MKDTHHFVFTYSDGEKITLSLAFENGTIAVTCNPPTVAPHHEKEYLMWTRDILPADILRVLPDEYRDMTAQLGAKILGESNNDASN